MNHENFFLKNTRKRNLEISYSPACNSCLHNTIRVPETDVAPFANYVTANCKQSNSINGYNSHTTV